MGKTDRGGLWRSRWAAVGAAVAVTFGLGGTLGFAGATINSGDKPVLVTVTPVRILNTRPSGPTIGGTLGPVGPNTEFTLQVAGQNGVPADATAVVLNVTAADTTAGSFLTVFPADATRPNASNLNWVEGQVIPNSVTVKLSADGKLKFYNFAGNVNVIADLAGYYVNHTHNEQRYINFDVNAALLRGGATVGSGFGANSGVDMPDTGTPAIDFNFTVPPDYVAGTNMTVDVLWHIGQTGCSVDLNPSYVSVGRAGQAFNIGGGASTGMASVGGNSRAAAGTSNVLSKAQFTLTSPTGTPLAGGDKYTFAFFRSTAADTCTQDAFIDAVQVTYAAAATS